LTSFDEKTCVPAIISSVSDRDSAALRELRELGLTPGAAVVVERRNSRASLSVRLKHRADAIRLGVDLAECISVIASAA